MLGLLFKIAHGRAHPSLCALFPPAQYLMGGIINGRPRHNKQLDNHPADIMFNEGFWRRSLFGLVFTFNRIPQFCIDSDTVSDFQTLLTDYVRTKCVADVDGWPYVFDARANFVHEGRYSFFVHGY